MGFLNLMGLFKPAPDILETEEGHLFYMFMIFVVSVYLTSNKC